MNARDALARAVALHRAGRLSEAIEAYTALLAAAPGHVGMSRALGMALLQSGRPQEGLAALEQADAGAPDDPRLQADVAVALRANGRHAEAVEIYRRLAGAGYDHGLALAMGDALHASGRPMEAIRTLEEALEAGAESIRCRLLLASCRADIGDNAAAIAILEAAEPGDDPRVLYALANALAADGQFDRAIEGFRALLAERSQDAELHSQLGAALVATGDLERAEASFRDALAITPDDHRVVFRLGKLLADRGRLDGEYLLRWLRLERPVSPPLRSSALEWLCADPDIRAFAGRSGPPPIEALQALASNPVLQFILRRTIIDDPIAERALTNARRGLMGLATGGARAAETEGLVSLACSLAMQCHLNEHVWSVTSEELGRAAALGERIENVSADEPDTLGIALLACYRPLYGNAAIAELARRTAGDCGELRDLVRVQIEEPAEEARLARAIPRLNRHHSETSRKVREQYEEHPYPRWAERPELPGGSLESVLLRLFPHLADKNIHWPDSPAILIAGCGTGLHSIVTAQRFPTASILAIDLSRRSLAYAVRCTREAGIGNLEYGQGDLLRVGELGRSFDVIESAGVLHHLLDPLEGWRQLVGVLRPGGFMKVGLYSDIGRRPVVAGRRFVAEGGWPGTTEGIREARQAIMALPREHPAAAVQRRPDFYSASACRDLLFHVQEHRYDLEQVDGMIRTLGLEFVGFELAGRDHAREYRARYPGDPDMLDLRNWAELEASRPGMFSGMYLFWVRKPVE